MSDMTLTDFLLARIAERVEWVAHPLFPKGGRERMLAECEAKRTIVAMYVAAEADRGGTSDIEVTLDDVLRHLALPYADHADYREEWRP